MPGLPQVSPGEGTVRSGRAEREDFNLFSNRPKKDCLIHFNKISIYEHLTIPLQTDHWEDECWVLSTPGQLCSVCSVPGHAAIVHSTQDYALRKVGRLSHGRNYTSWATFIVKFCFFGKNLSGPFIHITWYHSNCLKTSKGAPSRGF